MAIKTKFIWHQIHFERVKQSVQNKMLKNLEESRKFIKSKLIKLSNDIETGKSRALWSKKRLERQLLEIENSLNDAYSKMNSILATSNKELVLEEVEWNVGALQKEAGVSLSVSAPSTKMVMASVKEKPFAGWKSKKTGSVTYSHNSPLRKVPASHIRQMESIVRNAYLSGSSTAEAAKQLSIVDKLIAEIDSSYDLARRNTIAETRTSLQIYANKARLLTLEENEDIFPWVEFVATLDWRTTVICGALDGRTYRQSDLSKPAIPQHWNCRSTYVPKETKAEEIPGTRPQVAPGSDYESGDNKTRTGRVRKPRRGDSRFKVGQVSAKKNFQQWLTEQDKKNPDFVRDYFKTDKRYEDWKTGKRKNIKFTSTDGRTHGVKDLKNTSAIIKETNAARSR